jgi:hypothetical protein
MRGYKLSDFFFLDFFRQSRKDVNIEEMLSVYVVFKTKTPSPSQTNKMPIIFFFCVRLSQLKPPARI